jgi:formylglycine-generating enzyme required for sulfatase activity
MQEFLAGCYLGDHYQWEDKAGYEAFLKEKVGDSWWREVFILAAGYLAGKPGFYAPDFLKQVAAQGEKPAGQLGALALAARCLLQLRHFRQRPDWYAGLARQLAGGLYGRLYAEPVPAQPALCQEAGLALGLLYGYPGEEGLSDPRFPYPGGLPDFVRIEGGPFWMGDDDSPEEDERPRHRVYLDAFELARYPTTNAMFARFIADGGYGDRRWWSAAIADDRWADGKVRDYGGERIRPAYWDNSRFNNPAQPVVGVTWYEAIAYCAWLTATLDDGHIYRLPTEAEWERAARGLPSPCEGEGLGERVGRRYPWGDEWKEDHCNSTETGLGAASPVGLFPEGAAQGGLQDMAGNVYEWCQDWYAADYYARSGDTRNPPGPEEGEYRVLRGGSWVNEGPAYCRCGYRNWLDPRSWLDIWGFRCARTSSS